MNKAVFGFVFLLLFASFVSAGSMCDDDQLIMRLSGAENAHGAVYTDSDYEVEICYDQIFGESFVSPPGVDSHFCSGMNSVLRLSDVANAHAEVPNLRTAGCSGRAASCSSYNGFLNILASANRSNCLSQEGCYVGETRVLYWDYDSCSGAVKMCNEFDEEVSCEDQDGCYWTPVSEYSVEVCFGDLMCEGVVGLDCGSDEREIFSLSDLSNAHIETRNANNYDVKICCSSGVREISEVYWEDFENNMADLAFVNNTIKIVADTSFPEGTSVVFEIYENDVVGDDAIRTGASALSAVTDSSGRAVALWAIDDDDIAAGGEEDVSSFYSRASVGLLFEESGILSVENVESSNSLPVALISNPENGDVFFVGYDIQFSHDSFDLDDGIVSNVLWAFGDGTTSSESSPIHSFSSIGQKTITLEVEDRQGVKDEAEIDVLIVEDGSVSMGVSIDYPESGKAYVDENLEIEYNAANTYVARVSEEADLSCSIECVAGKCPEGSSITCRDDNPATVGISDENYSDFYFVWSFDDGGPDVEGFGKISGSRIFGSSGEKAIDLVVNYTNDEEGISLEGSVGAAFKLFDLRQCSGDGGTWFEIDGDNNIVNSYSTLFTGSCVGADGRINGGDDCCPAGSSCTDTGCVTSGEVLEGCSSYNEFENAVDLCNNDSLNLIGIDSTAALFGCGLTLGDGNVTQCNCEWDSVVGSCVVNVDRSNVNTGVSISSCSYETESISDCIGGVQTVSIKASGGPECVDSTETVLCGRALVELPFFGALQFLLCLMSITIVYLLWRRFK